MSRNTLASHPAVALQRITVPTGATGIDITTVPGEMTFLSTQGSAQAVEAYDGATKILELAANQAHGFIYPVKIATKLTLKTIGAGSGTAYVQARAT